MSQKRRSASDKIFEAFAEATAGNLGGLFGGAACQPKPRG
jgi:hypothetical protein